MDLISRNRDCSLAAFTRIQSGFLRLVGATGVMGMRRVFSCPFFFGKGVGMPLILRVGSEGSGMVGRLSSIECGVQVINEHISSSLPRQVYALRP